MRDLHSAYVHAGKLPIDKYLFNLQSKFLTRNVRGGEQEQILAVNHSPDPLPYIRPDTRAGILVGRPGAARKQAKVLPPAGSRWAKYKVNKSQLTGNGPYRVNVKVVAQMVPVNLIKEIGKYGFDYNMSPREVAKRVVWGHRVSPSKDDSSRRGGALTIWDRTLTIDGRWQKRSLKPTEKEIMAPPPPPFPVQPPEPEEESGSSSEPPPRVQTTDRIPEEDLEDLLKDGGQGLLPEAGLLPEKDGEDLLPGDSGESLLPDEGDEDGEALLPGDDGSDGNGESLLPDAEEDESEGESLLPE